MSTFPMLSPGQVIEEAPAPTPQEWEENLNRGLICPDCRENPPNITEDFSSGDTVCANCGLVLGERIQDVRSEWRTFANDESGGDDPSRVGKAESPLDAGNALETTISFGDGGMRSRELNRAHNKMNDDKGRKSLAQAYSEIAQACAKFELPETAVDYAKLLYKSTHNERLFKGKNPDAIRAGCIFIACRQNKMGRTFKEIQKATKVNKKDIGRTFKMLEEFLRKTHKLHSVIGAPPSVADSYTDATSTSTEDLCGRYGSNLTLSIVAINCSKQIAERLRSTGLLAGRSPLSAAAACIYMASHLVNDPKSPKEIARVAGVSDSTIRNAYKRMLPGVDKLVDKEWLKPAEGGTARGVIRGADTSRLPTG